jgi:hypothetical protein
MPDIDKMSLKELRAMLKEKRKTTQAPVSKMKKGQLMKELITNSNLATIGPKFEDPQPILLKKTAEQILLQSQKEKEYVPLEGYHYGAEEVERPGARRFSRVTGKAREASSKKLSDSFQQPVPKNLGKESLKQTDEPGSASQKVAPATKRQTAKRTANAEPDQPVGSAMRDIAESMVIKSKKGRPPKNSGMAVGVGQVPTTVAPIQHVLPPKSSVGYYVVEDEPVRSNLTRLVKPAKYGGGVVEKNVIINEPVQGRVKNEVVKIETKVKSKRGGWDNLTEEQKAERVAKMKAGREKKK